MVQSEYYKVELPGKINYAPEVNIEVKNYLLVLAYLNKYYKDIVKQDYRDLMIQGSNIPFEGTKLYSLIEEEVNKYQEPNISLKL